MFSDGGGGDRAIESNIIYYNSLLRGMAFYFGGLSLPKWQNKIVN